MPLVYMNSWASLALRAAALAAYALAALRWGTSPGVILAATALLLAANAAHPLSVSLRLAGASAIGLLSVAEGAVGLVLAAMLGFASGGPPANAALAATFGAPLALCVAVLALAGGVAQHDRLRGTHGGRWPALPIGLAVGSAGVALLAATQAQAIAAGAVTTATGSIVAALGLAAWVTHSALRLRRARRAAARARQRDWALVRPTRSTPAAGATDDRRLHPATQWS